MEVRSSGVRGPQEAPDCRGSKKVWSTENREDEGVVSRGQGEEGGTRVGEHRKDWRGKWPMAFGSRSGPSSQALVLKLISSQRKVLIFPRERQKQGHLVVMAKQKK